ncbi:MAG TPA: DUF4410 domain-containing protein [Pyrinomonadaceae bacterium]|nr:DUF4410 domain-containing protein [Pyrinomonadaceae bacterium]
MKRIFLAVSVCMMLAMAAFGQAAPATATAKGPYKAIEFERFSIRQGVEFTDKELDELMKAAVKNFTKSNRFDSVAMAGETPAESVGPKLRISGEITKYVKGSQAARYLIGFGAGKTKIMADIKMTDAATGEVVFNQVVDGDVTWGVFGGDSDDAKGGVADEVIREMKKRGLAGDKKKTK